MEDDERRGKKRNVRISEVVDKIGNFLDEDRRGVYKDNNYTVWGWGVS